MENNTQNNPLPVFDPENPTMADSRCCEGCSCTAPHSSVPIED
jgi:hypothetical protein